MGIPSYSFNLEMQHVTCYLCGVLIGMPYSVYDRRRSDGKSFWCVNGHDQHFTETRVQQLEKELSKEKLRVCTLEADVRFERGVKERVQKKLRRAEKRIGNGLCPCCNRTFENLQRHMHTKHPDYKDGTRKRKR